MSKPTVHQVSSEELDNCAREAIHVTTLLQPHGFLIACEVRSGLIVFASGNAGEFLPEEGGNLLGRPFDALIEGPFEATWARLTSMRADSPIPLDLRFKAGGSLMANSEVLVHRTGDTLVFEVFPHIRAVPDVEVHIEFERALRELTGLHSHVQLDDFLNACAREIRRLSGYQRVCIYRFLPDWCGEVIAESCDDGMDVRFMGLRFPASDIPAQARELYKINLLRIIGDVSAPPTVMQVMHPGAVLDLSHSMLRHPSSMHLKYLENMGVRATMTISLLKDGELWGMVACHHPESKTPPAQLRRVTKLLCAMVAEISVVRLDSLIRRAEDAKAHAFAVGPHQLEIDFNASRDFAASVQKNLQILSTEMKAQGHGLMVAGAWVCTPGVPPEMSEFLVAGARALAPGAEWVTHQLVLQAPAHAQWGQFWSGALVLRLPGLADSYVFFLRHMVDHQVLWAGAPSKVATQLPDGMKVLGPRASFEQWTQQVQGQCEPWDSAVMSAARAMAKGISDVYHAYRSQQLQTELHLLGSYMEHLNDMVVVTDTDSADEPGPRIVFVNQAFVNRTGYSREEVLGKSPRMLQGPETQRSTLDELRAAIVAWRPITAEVINYTRSGEKFWVEISLTPIANAAGWYTHWVAIERDITERKRAEGAIQILANYDPLTGLPNRRMLMDRLALALPASQRTRRNGALLFIDLDNFKDLNDTGGHFLGDALLKQAGQRLVAEVRMQDMVARLGGDEFVVMLEHLSADELEATTAARAVAEKIVMTMRQAYNLNGQAHTSTASVGVSLFVSDGRCASVDELLTQSDFAMYQAKGTGRNTWCFFDPASRAALMARNAIETDLKTAIAQQQLETHYQIIVDRHQQVIGVEALLRWRHPLRGLVSPVEFIPIAERTGLILPIGQWVLQTACELLVSWASSPGRCRWSIAVNVSARQVSQADFVAMVVAQVEKSACNPALLKLELTESLLQQDFDATVAKMDALRALGVQFSIDDFGTGYSSLAYLRRLPVSVLKIDRSFVRDIEQDEGDRAICKTVIALGKTLNLSIVAEGVETTAQFEFLQANGCDKFQGFLFGRPVPLAQL